MHDTRHTAGIFLVPHLKEVLPHASSCLGGRGGGLVDEHPIQGVLLAGVPRPKGQLGNGVTQIEVLVWEGH